MSMTSYERIKAALEGESVDRLPWSPFLAYVWDFFPTSITDLGMPHFLEEVGADPMWRGAPCSVLSKTTGVTERMNKVSDIETRHFIDTPVGSLTYTRRMSPEGNTNFLFEHPVKTVEDLKVQKWIAEHTEVYYDPIYVNEHFAGQGKTGLSIGMLIPHGKTAFQTLIEHFVGTEELTYMLMDYPEEIEDYLSIQVEQNLYGVKLALESDYEYFLTYEDSSTQNYSPAIYEKYIASEIKGYCDILKTENKKYVQHACGHLKDILEMMVESGVNSVESLSAEPTGNISIKDARKIIGDRAGIIGGIEPVHFLNTPKEELPNYVRGIIEEAKGGPFVLANSDSCPPGVTPEKFKIVGDVVRGLV